MNPQEFQEFTNPSLVRDGFKVSKSSLPEKEDIKVQCLMCKEAFVNRYHKFCSACETAIRGEY